MELSAKHKIEDRLNCIFLCVSCSCRDESEPHLTNLNLPLDPAQDF